MAQRLDEIQDTRLAERVHHKLRAAILDGIYAPGERLIEEEIARQVGLSRSPVREAIRLLQHEGLVDVVPRRGAFVIELTSRDANDVYAVRASLEALAVRLVQDRSTVVSELEDVVRMMRSSADHEDVSGLSDLDVSFHRRLVEASGNRRLVAAWLGLLGQVEMLSRRVIDTVYRDFATIPDRHQTIIDAIRSGETDTARFAIEDHVVSVAKRIVPLLDNRLASDQPRRTDPSLA